MADNEVTLSCVVCGQKRTPDEVFSDINARQYRGYCKACRQVEQGRQQGNRKHAKRRASLMEQGVKEMQCGRCGETKPIEDYTVSPSRPRWNWCRACVAWQAEEKRKSAKALGLTKVCRDCKLEFLATTEFFYSHPYTKDGLLSRCKECYAKLQKKSHGKHARRWREIVLLHYSGGETIKCACCGESRYEFMSIDHIDGGGRKERLQTKRTGEAFCLWLIRHRFPAGYQVLCHNCNMAKGVYGKCPHEREREAETATQER